MTTLSKINQFNHLFVLLFSVYVKQNNNRPTIKKPPITPSKPRSPLERGSGGKNYDSH